MGISLSQITDPALRARIKELDEIQNTRHHSGGRVAGLCSEVGQSAAIAPLERQAQGKGARRRRVATGRGPLLRVGIVTFTRKATDLDNAVAGCKGLRDEIATFFQLDDHESQIDWWYQTVTSPRIGTLVLVELM